MIRGFFVALPFLVLAGCSPRRAPADRANILPPLPRLDLATYRPQIRAQIQNAYDAVRAEPLDANANGDLGMELHAFDQLESAEICYRRARQLDPKQFRWAYYLGLVQALNGQNADAATSLETAIRIDAAYVPARIKLAEVLLVLGRFDQGRQICESILSGNPQVAPAHYWLGRIAGAQGQIAGAEEHYRKACDLWPTYGTAHYALALACQKSGQLAEAQTHIAAYQKYKGDGDPQPEDPALDAVRALDNSALAHLMKGVDLENSGHIEQAIVEHEQATRADPKLAQAWANLISLYARAGQPEKAEQAYRATVTINPNLPQSHYDYGVFMVSRARFPEAEAAFRKALQSSPRYGEAHSNLGAMLERRGKFEEAHREYEAAIEDKPDFRQAQYQLGHLLLLQKKTADAIAHLSLTLTPEDRDTPRFMYTLGIAYAEASDFANAEHYLQQAAQRASASGQNELAARAQMILARMEHRASQ